MTQRDFKKFAKEDGTLNRALVPSTVWGRMLVDYRRDPEAINAVFDEMWFLWDLQQKERASPNADIADLANEVMSEMDEGDYMRVRGAFERRIEQRFLLELDRWAPYLEEVYDGQEAAGWTAG